MNPLDQYELLQSLTSDSERETFEAREISTGRTLFVHFLHSAPSGIPTRGSLLELAQIRLRSERRGQGATTVYEVAGRCFVVTPATPEYSNPRPWLEQSTEVSPRHIGSSNLNTMDRRFPTSFGATDNTELVTGFSASQPYILARPDAAKPISEFEEQFGLRSEAKSPLVSDPSTGAESKTPGEFTRLFRKYSETPSPSPPRTTNALNEKLDVGIQRTEQREPAKSQRSPDSASNDLGSDSILPAPRESKRTEPIGRSSQSGDFTRMFVTPQKNKIADVWKKTDIDESMFSKPKLPAENTNSVKSPVSEHSESVFGNSVFFPDGKGNSQASKADETGWSRKLEVNLSAESPPNIVPAVPPPPQLPFVGGPQQTVSGPGEYTIVISAPQNTPPPVSVTPKTEAAAAQRGTPLLKEKSSLKLIVVLNVLAIIAVIWILYFAIVAMRK